MGNTALLFCLFCTFAKHTKLREGGKNYSTQHAPRFRFCWLRITVHNSTFVVITAFEEVWRKNGRRKCPYKKKLHLVEKKLGRKVGQFLRDLVDWVSGGRVKVYFGTTIYWGGGGLIGDLEKSTA